ncbi:hypothetical protein AJGP001_07710 [Planococcus faecalis]|uniref:Uncharacterized protein n=2 Tax=Caryophanaceae TaxID=186818 RepID=A0ABN4XHC0_9BACL|nr:hypothetical protein AJGP001_07710 [Planococcus faecalis]
MNYFAIALATLGLSIIIFFILGGLGFTDYVDGLIIAVGLIIVILLSIIISLLIKVDRKLKN